MRLIPGKTKVKIELFRGITIGDLIIGAIILALATLVLLSTFPGRFYIIMVLLAIGGFLLIRLDDQPNYVAVLRVIRYLAYPRKYQRKVKDAALLKTDSDIEAADEEALRRRKIAEVYAKKKGIDLVSEDTENSTAAEPTSETADQTEKTTGKKTKKDKIIPMEEIMPFTGIADGFIEYGGKYYGTVIEIDPVEFRFFSQFRRDASIENCLGKVLRALRMEYAANIVKIERPILYNSYLDKEYDKLDALRTSFEKGLLSEEELKARVEIQYERINELRKICYEEKVIQPFYYIALFNINKHQLMIETENALTALQQGELVVRRLEQDRDLAIFLKYSNTLDFDEWEIDRLDRKDYVKWAMPENLSFTSRTAVINGIVTHQMRVIKYPNIVGDAWLAGVMSIPATKVVIKMTPMERTKAIRSIDRSLQELRGQLDATGVDSKIIELQTHIETLSRLLVTLQQDNETLLAVNIYISMYDAIRTTQTGSGASDHSSLPLIADMKKTVRRAWQETGMRLNGMDFAQIECFIGAQISGYDPFLKDGQGIPSNTVAAMYPWIYARVSDQGGIRLGTNEGVPVFIDFFRRDSERVNSNMVIIGKSGSGKSYGTKSLLTNMASEDAKIFILDPENEYTNLAHNLHGKIINVGNAAYGRLNPFHIITVLDDDESEDGAGSGNSYATHLQFLEEFYRQILPDVDKEALEYLNALTERMYTNFNITMETDLSKLRPEDYPIFDDLYDLVLEDFQRTNNTYLRTMLQTLINYVSKFATGGRNSTIWNGPSSITTDENFTVFNFQSLLANRNTSIANAQMLLVLKYIDNEIIKNRDYNTKYGLNRKVVVVIDEAHVFIDTKFPVALDFMFQLAKRIRKYNGMQIVITQNIKDFVGSEEIARKSTAIINACQYSFIFGLAPNDMDDLCKLYEKAGGINEVEQDQIISAPRGHAFTVLSAKSRSSFKIEVPDALVEMFEMQHYDTHYFEGTDGAENWEDFVGESRAEHDANISDRLHEEEFEAGQAENTATFTFSEIGAEEADRTEAAFRAEETAEFHYEDLLDDDDLAEIEESYDDDDDEAAAPMPAPQPATPVQPAPAVQPVIDMTTLLAAIREEVRREISVQQQLQHAAAPQTEPVPMPVSTSPVPQYLQQETDEPEQPQESSLPENDTPEYDKESYEKEYDDDTEPVMDSDEDDESFVPSFDIMAMLDEQLDSYNEMTLSERMDEIEVDTMEVSLDELAAFVKESRKRKGV